MSTFGDQKQLLDELCDSGSAKTSAGQVMAMCAPTVEEVLGKCDGKNGVALECVVAATVFQLEEMGVVLPVKTTSKEGSSNEVATNDTSTLKLQIAEHMNDSISPELKDASDCIKTQENIHLPIKLSNERTSECNTNLKRINKTAHLEPIAEETTEDPSTFDNNPKRSIFASRRTYSVEPTSIPPGYENFSLDEGEFVAHFSGNDANEEERDQQAILDGRVNDHECRMLSDTGANITVVHINLVKTLGLKIHKHASVNINGYGGSTGETLGTVRLKIALGDAIYFGELWISNYDPNPQFLLILGMDFLSRAGTIIDTVQRILTFTDGYSVPMISRNFAYVKIVDIPIRINSQVEIDIGCSIDVAIPHSKQWEDKQVTYWVNRRANWATTIMEEHGKPSFIRVTNVGRKILTLPQHTNVGAVMTPGYRPNDREMVRITSNRYHEWQGDIHEGSYTKRFQRIKDMVQTVEASTKAIAKAAPPQDPPTKILARDPTNSFTPPDAATKEYKAVYSCVQGKRNGGIPKAIFKMEVLEPSIINQQHLDPELIVKVGRTTAFNPEGDDEFSSLAYLPEIDPATLSGVKLNDLILGIPGISPENMKELHEEMAKHLSIFIKHGNGCPPPAIGTVCDIDVGTAKPIALRARVVRNSWLVQLHKLLKDLLTYGLIKFSKSRWASPICLTLKKDGVNIRLCIDYRQLNALTEIL